MERSKDWMVQAKADLAHAKSDLERKFYDWACFSAQQAAEKAAKAVLIKLGAQAWGHSVYDLLENIEKKYKVNGGLKEGALELDKAYIPARYPDAHPNGSPSTRYSCNEAKRMIKYAEKIISFCEGVLS
jgi:HEPN domain-containing protein